VNPTFSFLAIAGALVAIALAFVLPALWHPRNPRGVPRELLNADICRQQLADVDRDCALGLVDPAHAEQARDELRRRLIAEAQTEAPLCRALTGRRSAVLLAVAVPLLAVLLYAQFGSLRFVNRSTEAATPGSAGVEDLEARVREQPSDARAWVLLARARMERSEFGAAAAAYQSAIARSAKVEKDPAVLCEFADALAMEQGGSLQGRPAELITRALAIDGRHPLALEMAGSVAYERAQYGEAAARWQELLRQLEPGSDRYRELSGALERARQKSVPR
jgi:cytochrome c-type biogenesis protein CcmH